GETLQVGFHRLSSGRHEIAKDESLDGERALFERLACDVLVSKNSGSQATEPKLQVAREMGLPVLVLARPALPPADREFADGEALLTAIRDWESA
ncbi:precorrin-6A/cobalt-precorrin-6A reductase, partial [Pseudomonas aeruginosa]|nr:precorrin-6A/cobalt-precorrin-6A reductase [Pseudomonas aeruginosa]